MSVQVGLDRFCYAPIIIDEEGNTEYGATTTVPNITGATINFNTDMGTFFADDGPRITTTQIGQVEFEMNIADLPAAVYAYLIGATHTDGVVDFDVEATSPDVAVGFRSKKANGEYRYIWLMKGKFGVPTATHQTQEGSVNFQPQTVNGRFVARLSDNKVFRRSDADDTTLPAGADLSTDWFLDPDYIPTALDITGIAVDEGTLSPAFSSSVLHYTVNVGTAITETDVTVTSTDTITIAGAPATTDVAQTVALGAAGTSTVIEITIADSGLTRTYTVTVNRAAA